MVFNGFFGHKPVAHGFESVSTRRLVGFSGCCIIRFSLGYQRRVSLTPGGQDQSPGPGVLAESHSDGQRRKYQTILESTRATFGVRTGYRYVADSPGFMAGVYLKIRHFHNRVRDQKGKEGEPFRVAIVGKEASALKRRLMTSLLGGLEIGWAF